MIIKRVGSGRDFETFALAVAWFYSLGPIADDIQFYLDGGLDEGDGTTFLVFNDDDKTDRFNGHHVYVDPWPGDEETPPTLKYRYMAENDFGGADHITFNKIKMAADCSDGEPMFTNVNIGAEIINKDCIVAARLTGFFTWDHNRFYNCTLMLSFTAWPDTVDLDSYLYNTVIVCYANRTVLFTAFDAHYCSIKNYNAAFPLADPGWVNTYHLSNPNFVGGVVVSSTNQDPLDMITKDVRITQNSAACLDNADPVLATPKDILGHLRR